MEKMAYMEKRAYMEKMAYMEKLDHKVFKVQKEQPVILGRKVSKGNKAILAVMV
jgi:hypothetical protein